jgi:hypothetical protein
MCFYDQLILDIEHTMHYPVSLVKKSYRNATKLWKTGANYRNIGNKKIDN